MSSLEERVKELEEDVKRHDRLFDECITDSDKKREDIQYLQNTVQFILDYLERHPIPH